MKRARFLVFVYGTLKKGEPNHHALSSGQGECRFIGSATLARRFPLVIATRHNIPFLVDEPGQGHQVSGEVYEVCRAKLEVLDELEGYPNLYIRREEQVQLDVDSSAGQSSSALVYLLPRLPSSLLASATSPMAKYSSDGSHGRPYEEGEECTTIEDLEKAV